MGAESTADTTVTDRDEPARDEVAAPEAGEVQAGESPDPGARRWLTSASRAAAVVVFLAAVAGAGYEGWLLHAQHQRQAAAHQALDAAKRFAGEFTNASPDTIDRTIDAITDSSTGDFKARYVRSISQLRAMLIEHKVTTRGTVVRSAIESVAGNKVEVLLFVKQSFTSAAPPAAPDGSPPTFAAAPPTEVVGMAITMEKVDGRWLVAKVVPGDQL